LFVSFRGGLRTLVDALASRLGECARLGTEVIGISRAAQGTGWRLRLQTGEAFPADAIVLAVPSYGAARILQDVDPRLARRLGEIAYASAATVNLAYAASDFPRVPETFGFVVPAGERRRIIACSFSSLKWAGRAPDGKILLRVFLGGALQDQMMRLDDAAMIATAREELASLLAVRAEPLLTVVRRWPDSMPQYAVGHLDRVADIEREASGLRGLVLAGAAYRGVGIPDCIRSGEEAAAAAFAALT
jgi:oxygen-dependent protoporphyrinogen oxidase